MRTTIDKPTTLNQSKVEALADFVWEELRVFFGRDRQKRPPLYLFLSPASRGSLKNRSAEEKAFVHLQQQLGGGATLTRPLLAYVSSWDQVPEEVAHLFVLKNQKRLPPKELDLKTSFFSTCLHECYGRFAYHLVFGLGRGPQKTRLRIISDLDDLWKGTHAEGYRLAYELMKAHLGEKKSLQIFRRGLSLDWYRGRQAEKLYTQICQSLEITPKSFEFRD